HPDAARPQRIRGRGVAAYRDGRRSRHRRRRAASERGGAQEPVSDPSLGLTMLGLIVVAIMMGFPTAFTLMGLGMIFGYIAFWLPGAHWYDNRIFDLIVQRTYGVMTNDTLLSVTLIVYAAVAGQSIVKLYAAAMLPGFFLTFLYLVYILGWAIINPKIAPKLPPDQYRVAVPDWLRRLERGRSRSVVPGLIAVAFRPSLARGAAGYRAIAHNLLALSVPLMLTVGTFAATWWYVVIYNAPEVATTAAVPTVTTRTAAIAAAPQPAAPAPVDDKPRELGVAGESETDSAQTPQKTDGPPEEMTSLRDPTAASGAGKTPEHFYAWFWGFAAFSGLLLLIYFWRMDGEQLEILKELCASVVPLGLLTVVVLAVILF